MAGEKSTYHHGDLRTALIDAASDVLRETGPQGMTIREVARRAGVSHAAPYRHFRDKDELAVAVVERGFSLLNEAMQAAREQAGDDPLDQFAASGEAYMQFARQYPAYYRVMFSGELLSSGEKSDMAHTSAEALREIECYVRELQGMGIMREDDEMLLSIALVSTMHGFLSLLNDGRLEPLIKNRFSPQQVQDFVIGAIFQGVGSRDEALPDTVAESNPPGVQQGR